MKRDIYKNNIYITLSLAVNYSDQPGFKLNKKVNLWDSGHFHTLTNPIGCDVVIDECDN